MSCIPIDIGVFVCTRGHRQQAAPCSACKDRPHEVLCDHPLSGKATVSTCSAMLCRRCAMHVDGKDLCRPHAKVHAAQIALGLR